jgi:hypothetical protein
MTCDASESVISGSPYAITEVAGHTATNLDEFTGSTEFVIENGGRHHHVGGVGGARHDDQVRFYEKDVDHEGRDVRVWTISSGSGRFLAEHVAAI